MRVIMGPPELFLLALGEEASVQVAVALERVLVSLDDEGPDEPQEILAGLSIWG